METVLGAWMARSKTSERKSWIPSVDLMTTDLPDARISFLKTAESLIDEAGIAPSLVRKKVRDLFNENRGRERPWAYAYKHGKKTPSDEGVPSMYARACNRPENGDPDPRMPEYRVRVRVRFFSRNRLAHAEVLRYYHYKPQAF